MIILERLESGKMEYKIIDFGNVKYNTDGTYKAVEDDLNKYANDGWHIVSIK